MRTIKLSTQLIFWGCTLALLSLFIYVFQEALLPFVLGLAIAYLLNPIVNRLGGYGLARGPATLVILGIFLFCLVALVAVIWPIAEREVTQLYHDMPGYIDQFWELTKPLTSLVQVHIDAPKAEDIKTLIQENTGTAFTAAQTVLSHLSAGGKAILGLLSIAVFMPVVAYFMMKEWPRLAEATFSLIPRHMELTIMSLLKEIDAKLSGFIRGQITVSFVLAFGYAIALSLAGLKYGFLIGFASGILSIIPLVGSVVGLVVSVAVAWFQAGDLVYVGIIAAIFIVGQVIEGNFLTPKLVGDSVGLHPLWVFFALLAGGSVLGILGMFLAVPVAAVIGVLLAFAVRQYKASPYYKQGQPIITETTMELQK